MSLDSTLFDSLNAEIALVAPTGEIVGTNRKWFTTASAGGLATKNWNYFDECQQALARGCLEARSILSGLTSVLDGSAPSYGCTYSCPFDGFHHWFEAIISPAEIDGRRHAVVMHVDVSALQRDPLTGLANRAFFDAQLRYVIETADQIRQCAALIIIDVDNLKPINDRYGHQAGDLALRSMADELGRRAGTSCLAARIGGDESGLVLAVCPDNLSARRMLARLTKPISFTIPDPEGRSIAVSGSYGTAVYPDDAQSASELYKSADRAMYRHKRSSRVA